MAVSVGSAAPDFQLRNTQGAQVQLSSFSGEQRVHLVFNRGFF